MKMFRFYCRPIKKASIELSVTEAHHLAAVLRLRAGDKVELFDGSGTLAVATVTTARTRKATVQVEQLQVVPRPKDRWIIIAPAVAKGDRFDWLIAKCTELGVDRICPILFERTVKQPKNPEIIQRWRNLAIAAAKQSGRLFLPQLDLPMPLDQILETVKKDYLQMRVLFGSPEGAPLVQQEPGDAGEGSDVVAFIGPEGGLTDEEQMLLRDHGGRPVRLSDAILRVETAALTFAAVLTAQRDSLK